MVDPLLMVGSAIHAKAKHVRTPFTCALLLGSQADEATANGVVTEVTRTKIDDRMSMTITGRF